MENNRTGATIKNSIYSLFSYVILLGVSLFNRKIVIELFSIELLGYEGLFSNIFSILSIAELGVGTVIVYNLYQEIVKDNKNEIAKLMMMFRNVYRLIGAMVTIIGIVLFFFLDIIVTDNVLNWNYVRVIYLIQLLSVVFTYFLSYKRTLIIANQREYECVKIDTAMNLANQITRLIVLLIFKNYLLYLLTNVIYNVLANYVIAKKCDHLYPYACKAKIGMQDFKERNFIKDVKNFMIHKLSYIVYSGVDSIVISSILGIKMVGLVSNYSLIHLQVQTLINKVVSSIQASIGNFIYAEQSKERSFVIFNMFDMCFFFIGAFVGTSYLVLFQPFIELFFGKNYLLSWGFVFIYSFIPLWAWQFEATNYFRNVFGKYENDRRYMVSAAIINLFLSIILGYKIGIVGIYIATILGMTCMIYGRIQFLFRTYFGGRILKYMVKHLLWTLLGVAEMIITYYVASCIAQTILGLIFKIIICLLIPNSLNLVFFYKTETFLEIKQYMLKIFELLTKKKVN